MLSQQIINVAMRDVVNMSGAWGMKGGGNLGTIAFCSKFCQSQDNLKGVLLAIKLLARSP